MWKVFHQRNDDTTNIIIMKFYIQNRTEAWRQRSQNECWINTNYEKQTSLKSDDKLNRVVQKYHCNSKRTQQQQQTMNDTNQWHISTSIDDISHSNNSKKDQLTAAKKRMSVDLSTIIYKYKYIIPRPTLYRTPTSSKSLSIFSCMYNSCGCSQLQRVQHKTPR